MAIHPTAVVDPAAELGAGVEIGPYAVIEQGVTIAEGCSIGAFAVIHEFTSVGPGCMIDGGAMLGGVPQDAKFKGERSFLRLGAGNKIREFATLHRASGEDKVTVVGDNCLIMAYAHVGHNCSLGDEVLLANSVALSGHCLLEDFVTVGGLAAIHQFTSIGTMAMVGGLSRIVRDVPPYMIVEGNPARPRGINVRGLARHDVPEASRDALRRAFRLLFRSDCNISDAILQVLEAPGETPPEVLHLVAFMREIDEGSRGRAQNP